MSEHHQQASQSMSLKVNLGVIKRTVKELKMYRQEVTDVTQDLSNTARTDNFYSQKAATLKESETMVKNTEERLRTALSDLESKLKGISSQDAEVQDAVNWVKEARDTLQHVN